jgi:predicted nucleotidyltransferase
MDKRAALKIAKSFVASLPEEYAVAKVFLFGSVVKGTAHQDSDIDIAVVLPRIGNSFDMRVKLMKISRHVDTRIEPHPIAEKEFNQNNALASEVLKYGIPIKLK